MSEASNYIPAAPIFLPEGPWQQIPGGVTAAKGFKAAGIFGGLRAKGEKPDLALVTCDVDATAAGVFTTNMVAAAPVLYCKNALNISKTARAVLINAGQANAATGDAGYQDVLESAGALAMLLKLKPEEVLIESTGVIGQRIKKEALLNSLPKLVNSLSPSIEGAGSAAVAITTTDLVSKSVAIESRVGGTDIKVGGMAKAHIIILFFDNTIFCRSAASNYLRKAGEIHGTVGIYISVDAAIRQTGQRLGLFRRVATSLVAIGCDQVTATEVGLAASTSTKRLIDKYI
ncbi:ARGININE BIOSYNTHESIS BIFUNCTIONAL PROTEIN ARGJ [Salix purpurea]|uniref:Arginine biosynthesis bifunctional protein ArgJ, chloroplastic n=1 Tax=Salix purpurea TaxID=77065 RepID=A0A9Q0VGI7_SALPP|nr:ARGININE BIOSYNTHESIS BIFUNCTIONAL PROTEIN ARGJ [Salix purpurea]